MFGWGKKKEDVNIDKFEERVRNLEREYFGLSLDIDQIRQRMKTTSKKPKEEQPTDLKKGMLSEEEAKALAGVKP